MAENSQIEWTEHTVNLWWGCAKVHTGCKNCYAENLSDYRYKNDLWGENQPRRSIKSAFPDLAKYQKIAEDTGIKQRVFVGSMMDIFEESKRLETAVRDMTETGQLRQALFDLIDIGEYNDLIFLFLTKRPQNIRGMIPQGWIENCPENVWFGTSVSDYNTTQKFIPMMNEIADITGNLFLSIEPQVEPIELIDLTNIAWVIQGGESGWNKRFFSTEWAVRMRGICQEAQVPYFFKQVDKVRPVPADLMIRETPWDNPYLCGGMNENPQLGGCYKS